MSEEEKSKLIGVIIELILLFISAYFSTMVYILFQQSLNMLKQTFPQRRERYW